MLPQLICIPPPVNYIINNIINYVIRCSVPKNSPIPVMPNPVDCLRESEFQNTSPPTLFSCLGDNPIKFFIPTFNPMVQIQPMEHLVPNSFCHTTLKEQVSQRFILFFAQFANCFVDHTKSMQPVHSREPTMTDHSEGQFCSQSCMIVMHQKPPWNINLFLQKQPVRSFHRELVLLHQFSPILVV